MSWARNGAAIAVGALGMLAGCVAPAPTTAGAPRVVVSSEKVRPHTEARVELVAVACAGRDVDATYDFYAHAGVVFERCKDAERPTRECAAFPPSPDGFMDSDERTKCPSDHPALDECRALAVTADGKAAPMGDCSLGSPLLDVQFDHGLELHHLRSQGETLVAEATVAGRDVDEIKAQYRLAFDQFQVWVVLEGRHSDLHGLWRRAPGAGDRWEQLAPSDFAQGGATRVLPLAGGDALVSVYRPPVADRYVAQLLRVHLGPNSKPTSPPGSGTLMP